MGQVLQAGAGQAPARQAAFKAGLAKTTTAETINKVCASGMLAVAHAARYIGDGDSRVVVAGGMESMSNAPYLLPGARNGYRYGHGALVDAMIHDGLWDYYFDEAMAAQGARVAAELGVTRAVQDEFAYQSHKRAHDAHEAGHFDAEIAPINVATKAKGKIVVDALPQPARARIPAFAGAPGAGGSVWDHVPPQNMVADPAQYSPYVTGDVPFTRVDRDEPVRRDASIEAMAKLKPIDKDGTITAGNAPGVNDGAAALVLSSADVRAVRRRRAARGDRRSRRRRVGSAVSCARARDGGAEAARSARAQGVRHPRLGDQRGVRRGRVDRGGAARARSERHQRARRGCGARASDRRFRRAHRWCRRAAAAAARWRAWDCCDLLWRWAGGCRSREGRVGVVAQGAACTSVAGTRSDARRVRPNARRSAGSRHPAFARSATPRDGRARGALGTMVAGDPFCTDSSDRKRR